MARRKGKARKGPIERKDTIESDEDVIVAELEEAVEQDATPFKEPDQRSGLKKKQLVDSLKKRINQKMDPQIAEIIEILENEEEMSGQKQENQEKQKDNMPQPKKPSWADEMESVNGNCNVKTKSAWDNFDINKLRNAGCKLNYVAPADHRGTSMGKIELEDVKPKIEYWSTAVVCFVLGANPPFSVLNGYIRRIWGKLGIDKIAMLPNGMIMVRFTSQMAKDEVLQMGVYHFDRKPVIVKPWSVDLELSKKEANRVPIWIQLPGLDLKYWGAPSLSKIASVIGTPIMADKLTLSKERLNYARILVDMEIANAMPEVLHFVNEYGLVIEQKISYEWKPLKCELCKGFGHDEKNCKKNEGRPVWRPKVPMENEKQQGKTATENTTTDKGNNGSEINPGGTRAAIKGKGKMGDHDMPMEMVDNEQWLNLLPTEQGGSCSKNTGTAIIKICLGPALDHG